MSFNPGSRARLGPRSLPRFPSDSLFDRVARVVCNAACLPRKELYESWEVARRLRRQFRGGRVVDLAGGHGLLAHLCLLLDDSSRGAVIVDRRFPQSALTLAAAIVAEWPRLQGRVSWCETDIAKVPIVAEDLVVSVHACGGLTDSVIDRAALSRARVAVMPCCHDFRRNDTGGLEGWMDGALAIDAVRAMKLRALGYRVRTQLIPPGITEKRRLLMAEPLERTHAVPT